MMQLSEQIKTLETYGSAFSDRDELQGGLKPSTLTTFQMNLGKLCNQACRHCHVEAGPNRTELMTEETILQCLEVIRNTPSIQTVDVTGGAPEMNPHFKMLVEELHKLGKHIIDRCNLTILEEPGYEYLYDFLKEHKVEIIASLPHYASSKTDNQRGRGVFDKSVIALQKLNKMGYGTGSEESLPLNLVYNPNGLFLSGSQSQLEREFKENLMRKYNITFHNLYCINNIPINRFLDSLVRKDKFQEYMDILVQAYNPSTVDGLMCRSQVSVSYDGRLFDCDFNQMLDLEVESEGHIRDFNLDSFSKRSIKVLNHCYGCTAGSGSSCGGALE
jgi:radical SAM/Cys-rich protein